MACVGDNTLVQFVEGRLAGDRLSEVEDHLAGCPSCRSLVSELGRSSVVPSAALPSAPSLFSPGARIAGRWEVTRFIAAGGMGEVYEVVDRELGARMALKTMRPELAAEARALDRFKREIHLARKVTHPNVCRIFDFGVHTTDNGAQVPFLTMELLDGPTLSEHLSRVGRLTPATALPLVDQLTAALQAAHQAGVVHRDFKPQNIVLVDTRTTGLKAVVTDFGVARAFDGDDLAATRTGARGLIGSPAYMAPEQVEGRPAGPAADLYGLGVVLFEMVTGSLPFEGESPLMTALMRLERPPPSAPRSQSGRSRRSLGADHPALSSARGGRSAGLGARSFFSAVVVAAAKRPALGADGAANPGPVWRGRRAASLVAAGGRRRRRAGVDGWRAAASESGAAGRAQGGSSAPRSAPGATNCRTRRCAGVGDLAQRSAGRGGERRQSAGGDRAPAVVSLTLPHEVSLTLDGYQPARLVVQSPGDVTVHLVRSRAD